MSGPPAPIPATGHCGLLMVLVTSTPTGADATINAWATDTYGPSQHLASGLIIRSTVSPLQTLDYATSNSSGCTKYRQASL